MTQDRLSRFLQEKALHSLALPVTGPAFLRHSLRMLKTQTELRGSLYGFGFASQPVDWVVDLYSAARISPDEGLSAEFQQYKTALARNIFSHMDNALIADMDMSVNERRQYPLWLAATVVLGISERLSEYHIDMGVYPPMYEVVENILEEGARRSAALETGSLDEIVLSDDVRRSIKDTALLVVPPFLSDNPFVYASESNIRKIGLPIGSIEPTREAFLQVKESAKQILTSYLSLGAHE